MKIELNEIAKQALDVAKERERLGQLKTDTLSILKHCAGEVCEAVEAYSEYIWRDTAFSPEFKEKFADELADIITCVLIAAALKDIDIDEALFRVQNKNLRRIKR